MSCVLLAIADINIFYSGVVSSFSSVVGIGSIQNTFSVEKIFGSTEIPGFLETPPGS